MHGFISGLSIDPLVYMSVSVPVPYCLDDCSFVVEPQLSRQCGTGAETEI